MIATTARFLVQLTVFRLFTLAPHLFGIDCKKLLKLFRGLGRLRRPRIRIEYGCTVRISAMRKPEQQPFLLS